MTRSSLPETIAAALAPVLARLPGTITLLPDRGTAESQNEIDAALANAPGIVVTQPPIISSAIHSQRDNRIIERARCVVHVLSNPVHSTSASVAATVDAILCALIAQDSWLVHLGYGDRQEITELISNENGYLTYAINFTATLSTLTK